MNSRTGRSRFPVGMLAALVAAGLLGAGAVATADDPERNVRWDIISLDFATTPPSFNPGGFAEAKAPDGATIRLMGSGTFVSEGNRGSGEVTGGGEWETFDAAGTSTGSGTYEVRRLITFQFANFQSQTPPFTDNIGDTNERANGTAVLKIKFSDRSVGVLTVGCHGPGAPPGIFEGVAVTKGFTTYYDVQPPADGVDANRTLFHVPAAASTATRLVAGLASGSGSTVGPDGALYVTEGAAGRVSRVDPQTGVVTTYASGLPPTIVDVGIGGAMDIEFRDSTAYVLVTLVGPDVGGSDVVGIYRVDDPDHFTVIADIGAWSLDHPPATPFDVATGVQYAMQKYRDGFLVTDGHLNRVLRVTLDGTVTEVISFGNIVPTGLELRGNTVYLAEAGPVPHLPQDGKVVSFQPGSDAVTEVAAGGRLLVDVEFGTGHDLFALAQGEFTPGNPPGSPANPNTGQLLKVDGLGGFAVVEEGLNQPTSLELIGRTAYVVTFGGEIWRIETSRDD